MVKEIFFTARQFTAQEACDMGLVNRVPPSHMLEPYVADYVKRMAENAHDNGVNKVITADIQKPESERDRARIDALVKACFDSEDYIEGCQGSWKKAGAGIQRPVRQGK